MYVDRAVFVFRLAQALVVINDRQKMEAVERSTLCTDAECSDKVLMREKVVVDTAAVDDLIQKFKNGLEVSFEIGEGILQHSKKTSPNYFHILVDMKIVCHFLCS